MSTIIEFLGMPRAGKSTQIKLLKNALVKKGYSVKVITDRFRASKIKTPPSEIIAFKLVFFSLALEEYFRSIDKYDFIIIDRGFNDSVVWFDVERELQHISSKRSLELKKTFLEFVTKVDKIIYMIINPTESSKRHLKTKHMKIDDVGMSKEYLTVLQKAYNSNKNKFRNCLYIEELDTIQKIHQKILNHIDN
jgi:thymidylate kinase